MFKKYLVFITLILILFIPNFGQSQSFIQDNYDKNVLKLNLTGIAFNNYGIQYERMITKRTSFALGLRTMPKSKLPFYQSIDLQEFELEGFNLESLTVGNSAITPEIRFYLGKKEGPRGFYIAPYFRYSNFDFAVSNFEYTVEIQTNSGFEEQIKTGSLTGNLSGTSTGIMFGAQWKLGRSMYLDWWILGGGIGKSIGSANVLTPLNFDEQEMFVEEFSNLEIERVKINSIVNDNGFKLDARGPWASIRGGISIGFKF
jgi:hypothetical protein